MARGRHMITSAQVRQATEPGLLADGGGLYLQITTPKTDGSLRKSWLFRFTAPNGRRREMGLGSLVDVSLAQAREFAERARQLAKSGIDPIEQRKANRTTAQLPSPEKLSFRMAAEAYINAHRITWSNDKHARQWARTLDLYAHPVFGDRPVDEIDVEAVLQAIEPIWATKTETASRVRGRIETILDWAAVRGYRSTENPARWRGHLQRALPARSKTSPVRHFSALPVDDTPPFVAQLQEMPGIAPKAFAFCILTATRTSETLLARWDEVDPSEQTWLIPAERMKSRRPHRVPLSRPAVTILDEVAPLRSTSDWVFPSPRDSNRPLSNMAFLATLKRMNRRDLTAHGFRSTFRDWTAERTDFSREVAEAALAHVVGDRVEAAYRRGDLFEKRRALMEQWAEFAMSQRG